MISTTETRARRIRLSRRHEWMVYAIAGFVFVSGAAWAWLQHFPPRQSDFGQSAAALWAQKIHGLSAMCALILLGSLLIAHVPHAWRAKRNRRTGGLLLAFFTLLAGTGYALYYSGDETLRAWMGSSHLYLGLAFPFLVALHVWRGKKTR